MIFQLNFHYIKIVSNSLWFSIFFFVYFTPPSCANKKHSMKNTKANSKLKWKWNHLSIFGTSHRQYTIFLLFLFLILFSCELMALLFENKQHLHSQLQPICVCAKVCKHTDSHIMYSRNNMCMKLFSFSISAMLLFWLMLSLISFMYREAHFLCFN